MPENRSKTGGKAANSGQFQKGRSGNPGGRPRKDPAVAAIIERSAKDAAAYMEALVKNPEAKDSDRLRAAEYILDRKLGKAMQPIQADFYQSDTPLTLNEMQEIARELIAGDG